MLRLTKQTLSALTLVAGAIVTPSAAQAEPTSFDFQDPKGVNGVVFVLDSKLEPITGMVGGVGGTVSYDPADPTSLAGEVTVDLAEISMINDGMVKALKGNDWLDFSGKFVATMTFNKVLSHEPKDEESNMLEVEGTMSFGEINLPMTVMVDVTHLPDAAKDRGAAKSGDLLVLRSMFNVSRLDLGIKPDMGTDKVGEDITVMVPIVGYSE